MVPNNVKLYERDAQSTQDDLWICGERLKKLDEILEKIDLLQKSQYGLNYPSFPLLKKYFRGEVTSKDWVCFAGYRRFVLLPDGLIQMCGNIIGSIRDSSVKEIWNSKLARKRRMQIKKCRNFCLQDCHAKEEARTIKKIIKQAFEKQK